MNVEDIKDLKARGKVQDVLHKLGSGEHPSVREIMEIKPIFESGHFSLTAIHGPHVVRDTLLNLFKFL